MIDLSQEQMKVYEDWGMIVHKSDSTPEQYLQETANWEKEIEQLINEPALVLPKGMTREQRRAWLKAVEAGEVEGEWV